MDLIRALVVIACIAAVFAIDGAVVRYRSYRSLQALLEADELDAFFKKLDGPLTRSALSPFARERLRFLGFCRKHDQGAMVEQFNGLMGFKLNDAQRAMLLADGFNGFVQIGDARHCRRILEEMPRCGMSDRAVAAYQRHYDLVLAHKPAGYKRKLESEYATLRGVRRGYAAYLLSFATAPIDSSQSDSYRQEASRLLGIPQDQLSRRINVCTTV